MFGYIASFFIEDKTCKSEITEYNNGDIDTIITYYGDQVLHSYNGEPSVKKYNIGGIIIYQAWHNDGKLNSLMISGDNKNIILPAEIDIENDTYKECYYKNGLLHREDGPAIIIKKNNKLICQKYYIDGKLNNNNGPAIIEYDNDIITKKSFYRDGLCHNDDDKPAILIYNNDKKNYHVKESYYFNNGVLHRHDKPSVIFYNTDTQVYDQYYYEHGNIII